MDKRKGTGAPFEEGVFNRENKFNFEILQNAGKEFRNKFPRVFKTFDSNSSGRGFQPLIPDRADAVLRATTYDLLRYATYHHVVEDKVVGRFKICPAVRAAYFTKWIMLIRPYCLDSFTGYSDEVEKYPALRCNEFMAIIAASICMSPILVEPQKNGQRTLISDFLDSEELSIFMYHLRYRVKHQDSYTLFYRRIKEQQLALRREKKS